jgi:hypothetical protein
MVLTALTVLPDGQNVAPNIYLDGFYAEYKAGSDLSTIMDEIADMCVAHIDVPQQFATIGNDFKNFDYIKDRVIMVAVSRERNAELLTQVPHHNREDLALIYKVLIDQGAEGIGTITIRNEHMAFWDVTADDIKSLAEKNSVELLPAKVQSMDEVMREMFAKDGMDDEMMEAMFAERPIEEQMFVISNESRVNGAAAMFYEGVLSKLAERMGSDLYILPSSVHECIAVSSNMGTPEGLAEMVSEINEGQVSPEERLSDHVVVLSHCIKCYLGIFILRWKCIFKVHLCIFLKFFETKHSFLSPFSFHFSLLQMPYHRQEGQLLCPVSVLQKLLHCYLHNPCV